MESADQRLIQRGPSKVDPLLVPKMISNMAAGNVSIALGARGKCTNVVTACASGTHCIGDAFRAIQYGDAEVMIAGGTEGAISPVGVAGFTNLTALSTSQDPYRASIPFDKERGGFVIGEGAGVVVLEELEHAKARGAHTMLAAKDYHMDKIAIAGGVASNGALREAMTKACEKRGYKFYRPSPIFCTDNAAMIGVAAYYEYIKGTRHGWDLNAVPNLKLGER